jgi:hypothetical protein
MGGNGGGGGGWNKIGDIRALEERARAALQGGKRNVFISFAAEDLDEVNLLRAHAKNENSDIEFNDHSVREPYESDRADYIKRRIEERISRASCTVVYLSDHVAQSSWVAWEVQRSRELGKKVIAVHPGTSFKGTRPSWLDGDVEVVAWSNLASKLK